MAHRIRLAGPWESQAVAPLTQCANEPDRLQLPFSLTKDQRDAGLIFIRRFHRPTGIDESTELRIICHASEKPSDLQLNGQSLADRLVSDGREFCCEVTGFLKSFNQLSVMFPARSDADLTMECVWLEIAD